MENTRIILSIIIPAYNAEKYIHNCLQGVLHVISDDVEIIVINDGSKDETENLLAEYEGVNSNLKIFTQDNTGVSGARNKGINESKGEYICFIDCDDLIDYNSLRDTIDFLRETPNEQLLIFSIYEGSKTNGYKKVKYNFENQNLYELYKEVVCQKLNEPWKKIYSSNIIKMHSIQFDISMYMGEDICFFAEYIKHIEGYRYIDNPFYYYEKNLEGACANINCSYFEQKLRVHECLHKFIESTGQGDMLHKENNKLLLHIITRDIQALINMGVNKTLIAEALQKYKVEEELNKLVFSNIFDCVRKRLVLKRYYRILALILNWMKRN